MRNNKGYETKYRIISAAKKLFYEKGLENTKIKEICYLSNVKTGNFKYYFNQKYDLAKEIFGELLMKCYIYTDIYGHGRTLTSFEKNFRATLLFYRTIFSDPKNIAYYYETIQNKPIYQYMNLNVRRSYQRFIKEFSLDISDEDFEFLSMADFGIRREFAIEYIEAGCPYEIEIMVEKIYILLCRLFRIDEDMARGYIANGLEFVNQHDFSHLKLLV